MKEHEVYQQRSPPSSCFPAAEERGRRFIIIVLNSRSPKSEITCFVFHFAASRAPHPRERPREPLRKENLFLFSLELKSPPPPRVCVPRKERKIARRLQERRSNQASCLIHFACGKANVLPRTGVAFEFDPNLLKSRGLHAKKFESSHRSQESRPYRCHYWSVLCCSPYWLSSE